MISLTLSILLLNVTLPSLDSPPKIELIRAGQAAVFDCRWPDADSIFTELYRIDRTDPAVYLYRAAALQAEMTDREQNLYGEKFLAQCDSAKSAAEDR